MEEKTLNRLLRKLPRVDELLERPFVLEYLKEFPRQLVKEGINQALNQVRHSLINGDHSEAQAEKLLAGIDVIVERWIKRVADFHLKPVVNATGVVLHTNLGRAPLSAEAINWVAEISRGYSNLEYDLDEGRRGSRYSHVENLLKQICGVESAFVVNNNASAVLLALNTFAREKEVIVSRGEMIEIGGSFRIPEIMKIASARLVEVGTTNKTHLKDYEEAITENTAMLLKVHPSNYRVVGFTKEVELEELVELGRKYGIPVMYDAGSGALVDFTAKGFHEEPSIQRAVRSGASIITFSGDKLLGGPQAGLIVGKAEYVEQMKKNHLNRALRIDKMTLAALEVTLRYYLEDDPWQKVPVLRMLSIPAEKLRPKAASFARRLRREFGSRVDARVVRTMAQSGGGALPGVNIPSYGVAVSYEGHTANCIEEALRHTDPPVIVTIQDEKVVFDMRTLLKGDEARIISALKQIGL